MSLVVLSSKHGWPSSKRFLWFFLNLESCWQFQSILPWLEVMLQRGLRTSGILMCEIKYLPTCLLDLPQAHVLILETSSQNRMWPSSSRIWYSGYHYTHSLYMRISGRPLLESDIEQLHVLRYSCNGATNVNKYYLTKDRRKSTCYDLSGIYDPSRDDSELAHRKLPNDPRRTHRWPTDGPDMNHRWSKDKPLIVIHALMIQRWPTNVTARWVSRSQWPDPMY